MRLLFPYNVEQPCWQVTCWGTQLPRPARVSCHVCWITVRKGADHPPVQVMGMARTTEGERQTLPVAELGEDFVSLSEGDADSLFSRRGGAEGSRPRAYKHRNILATYQLAKLKQLTQNTWRNSF